MTDPAQRLLDAQVDATAARERLSQSLAGIQSRLNPKRIAQRAVHDVTEAGATAAEVGVDTARRHPATLVGIATAAGIFLARHRIARLVARVRGATD